MENGVKNDMGGRKWHFWFLVSFSLFLVVTFVYYLPLRFRYAAEKDEHGEMREMMHDEGMEQMMREGEMEPMMHQEDEHREAAYHEEEDIKEGLAVNLNVSPVPVTTGTTTRFDFFVNTKPGNVPVPIGQLEIEHEKYMHVIGVRDDLNEFFHIHPMGEEYLSQFIRRTEPIDPTSIGYWGIGRIFAFPGRYKIWSEIKKDGVVHSFGHPEFQVNVANENMRVLPPKMWYDKQVSFARNVIAGGYRVSLKASEPVLADHEHDLSFDIHTLTGQEVSVESYLGAPMHLTIIKDDWKQFIHTHPESGNHQGATRIINEARAHGGVVGEEDEHSGEDEVINFHVTFSEPGLYKAFAQFRPEGINLPQDNALTVSFWIEVKEYKGFTLSSWWILLIISLVLIVLLSFGIRRFLRVRSV